MLEPIQARQFHWRSEKPFEKRDRSTRHHRNRAQSSRKLDHSLGDALDGNHRIRVIDDLCEGSIEIGEETDP